MYSSDNALGRFPWDFSVIVVPSMSPGFGQRSRLNVPHSNKIPLFTTAFV